METCVELKILIEGTVITLVESNLDLSKPTDKIELKKDSFIQYKVEGSFLGIVSEEPMMYTKTITGVNDDGTYSTMTILSGTIVNSEIKTITEIDKDGKLSVSYGKYGYDYTKDEFLSGISYASAEKVLNLKLLDEESAVIDTEFGKRSVTIKTVEAGEKDNIVKYKYYCGNDGIIYLIETQNPNEYTSNISIIMKSSTLLTIGS